MEEEQLSNRKTCELAGISRKTYRYQQKPEDDSELRDALTKLTI